MSRSAASPRPLQPYSPRRPSPLGLPPLAYHSAFQDGPYSAFPRIPEEFEATSHMRFVPEVRCPLAGGTRSRAPIAPLTLDTQHHPIVVQQPNNTGVDGRRNGNGQTLQPPATEEMRMPPPPSPTPSSASSLSLYSAESVKKSFSIEAIHEAEEERRKGGCGFYACFSAFFFPYITNILS